MERSTAAILPPPLSHLQLTESRMRSKLRGQLFILMSGFIVALSACRQGDSLEGQHIILREPYVSLPAP